MSKRKHEEIEEPSPDGPDIDDLELNAEDIEKLLADAPQVEALTSQGLRRMMLALEKKINKNQELRIKHSAEPEKFMESEIELDEAIKQLQTLAAAPELYEDFVKLGAITSLLGLLQHENTDIAVDTVDLFHELTEPDTFAENPDARTLVSAFLESNGLELLLSNLQRLDETQEEEKQGVFNTLGVIENLSEIEPSICPIVFESPSFLPWALKRLAVAEFDNNKGYCCEVLSILLQHSESNRKRFGEANGIDTLLVCISAYKRSAPVGGDEEEYAENLFDSLCSSLLFPANRAFFEKAQGIELMLMCIKAKKFSRKPALKALDYALDDKNNCLRFVEALGLKTLFAAFMKKDVKKARKGFSEEEDDEHIISSIASLFKHLEHETDRAPFTRLISKFSENGHEKVERLIELHFKYWFKVKAYDDAINEEKQRRKEAGEDLTEDDEEYYLSLRLDEGHLFPLQLIDLVISFIHSCGDKEMVDKQKQLFHQHGRTLLDVKEILTEYAADLGSKETEEETEKAKQRILSLAEKLGQ